MDVSSLSPRPPLIAIAGPTASGKTGLALRLARQLGAEIVNADSRQVYRLIDIGTAKPTPAERTEVPHHLLDLVLPSEEFTLANYLAAAHAAIAKILARGRVPLLVGGTGLYVRAVARGYDVPAVAPDLTLRSALQAAWDHDPETVIRQLRSVDPDGAARIDLRNPRRVIRALEVSLSLGVPFSRLQCQESPYRPLILVLRGARQTLYARADTRLDAMLAAGFEEEVAGLLAAGYDPALPAFSALGYRELASWLRGETTRANALDATRASTHAFIRRQETWFRAEQDAICLDIEREDLDARALAEADAWLARAPA